jgi:hypothetical protein
MVRKRSKNYTPSTEVGLKARKTICVNFFAGAGAGKSTIALFIMAFLKAHGITSEYTGEYAKDLAWEKRLGLDRNQIKIFANQHNRQFRLNGQVDCIISDSPLLLSIVYGAGDGLMDALVMKEFKKYENINFYVIRKKKYIARGRVEDKKTATSIDVKTKNMLIHNEIPYTTVEGTVDGANEVLTTVLKRLNVKQKYKIQTL